MTVASVALLVFTNGPVLLFSKSVLDRTGRWEDLAVWPFLAAAAVAGAALAAWNVLGARRRSLKTTDPIAAAAVAWFTLAALASTLWSVDPAATGWRSALYVGMALLAWAIARLDDDEAAATVGLTAAAAVAASLLLVTLRPDLGLDANDYWKGTYTNRNSLAPLAAIGVLAGIRFALEPRRILRGRANRRAIPAHTGEAVARAARERSEQERGIPRRDETGSHPFARPLRAAAVGLALGSAAALIGAGGRTAWVSLVAALVVSGLPLLHHRVAQRRGRSYAAKVTAAAAAASTVAAAACLAAVWNVPTLSQRRTIWSLVWDRISERPLAGYGFFTFWDIEELTQHVLLRRGSAHNSLVEVALGLGLLGVVPFAAIVIPAARNAGLALWRRPNADTWMWAALVAFLLMENITESFVLWFSYSWVLLMAAALKPAPAAHPHAGTEPAGPPQSPKAARRGHATAR